MKKIYLVAVAGMLMSGLALTGCAKKSADSGAAVQQAQTLKTTDEKVQYLIGQANAFLSSKEFDQAIKTAQYVLSNLDANSADAKSIIEKAKAELQKVGTQAVNDLKQGLGSFGK
jgi:hypothetical protein